MRVLGIETSCDETAAAVVEDGRIILSSVVASQVDLHAQFGGIYPEVASRQHILNIYPIIETALREAHMDLKDVDAIAVTRGPGLPGSLVVGINAAKGLSLGSGLPLLGINHLEGHLYSAWLHEFSGELPPEPRFPLLALIVSGGHTELALMEDHRIYRRLGGTLDDAAGEAFDKVARLIGLSYPGGPAIQRAAEDGNSKAIKFPRAWLPGTWNFSFSGLKTAVLRTVRELEADADAEELPVADLAASFQDSVVDVLVKKTLEAAKELKAKEILVAGGVSANKALRETMIAESRLPVHIPPLSLCTDNAAMIAGAGCYRFDVGQRDGLDMDALPTWPLSEISS
ncbi:MAG: tRNA (adenosine(37)-N6)-threonylcarbamoyltransferase complex transferase subunit TsaD [Anaerolineales bacterium]|nr:tRNA (adenosine(37)-N6)-threonylcarbamoyltransferase complex transferase subunit TsaD [Chloroflexota bacterium]MBL6980301.1 tRNA (adenosine(37)-N6)-threonylcarbamoyltransferase complex transferase subunit TsaD [Anaerolineales bacterium]